MVMQLSLLDLGVSEGLPVPGPLRRGAGATGSPGGERRASRRDSARRRVVSPEQAGRRRPAVDGVGRSRDDQRSVAGDGDWRPAAGDGDWRPAAGDGDWRPAAGDGDWRPAAGDGDWRLDAHTRAVGLAGIESARAALAAAVARRAGTAA